MINTFQLLKQFDSDINTANLTKYQKNMLLHKYVELLLSDLKEGDIIEGFITKISEHKYALQIRPQVAIPIHMEEELEIGKKMNFIIQGKEQGKLYLQPQVSTPTSKETSLVQKAIETFQLPQNISMKSIINHFLQKQLPLEKETLLQAYQVHKVHNVPIEIVVTLMDKQENFVEQTAHSIMDLREGTFENLVNDFKTTLQNIDNKESLLKILNTVKEEVRQNKASIILEEFVKEVPKQTLKQALQPDKLQVLDTKVIKEIIGRLYDEITYVNIKDIKNDSTQNEKIYQTYRSINRVLENLDKLDKADKLELSPKERELIHTFREPLNTLGKANLEAQYFLFPVIYENHKTQGELYFFKPPHKHKKKQEDFYLVLGLTLPHINQIQIHINKQDKNITLHFDVEEEQIQKHLLKYVMQLNDQIQSLGFSVKNITWGLLNKNESLITEDHLRYSLNHMDLRI